MVDALQRLERNAYAYHELHNRILREFGGETGERIIEDLLLAEDQIEQAESFWNHLSVNQRSSIVSSNNLSAWFSTDYCSKDFGLLEDSEADDFIGSLRRGGWLNPLPVQTTNR